MQSEFSNLRRRPPPLPPETQQRLQCPRCNSTNTKFCYYNNYSLSQPRYFCKSCRRYWTRDGATLRNIPAPPTQRPQALPLLPLTPPLPSYSPQRVPPSLNVDASESFTELLNSQGSGFPGLEIDFGSDLEVVGGVGAGQVAIGEDVELEEGSGFAWPELTVAAPEGRKKTGLDSSRPE